MDPTEKQDVARFITKAQKQPDYKDAVMAMGPVIQKCMKQNGTADIYESYFDGAEVRPRPHRPNRPPHPPRPPRVWYSGWYFAMILRPLPVALRGAAGHSSPNGPTPAHR